MSRLRKEIEELDIARGQAREAADRAEYYREVETIRRREGSTESFEEEAGRCERRAAELKAEGSDEEAAAYRAQARHARAAQRGAGVEFSRVTERVKPYIVKMTCGHYEKRMMRPATAGVPWQGPNTVVAGAASRACVQCDPEHAPPGAELADLGVLLGRMATRSERRPKRWEFGRIVGQPEKLPVGTRVCVGRVKPLWAGSWQEGEQPPTGTCFAVDRSNGYVLSGRTDDGRDVAADGRIVAILVIED